MYILSIHASEHLSFTSKPVRMYGQKKIPKSNYLIQDMDLIRLRLSFSLLLVVHCTLYLSQRALTAEFSEGVDLNLLRPRFSL